MPDRSGPGPGRLAIGGLCVAAGAVLLLGAAVVRLKGIAWQGAHQDDFQLPARGRGPVPEGATASARSAAFKRGQAIGRLRLARLGIDAVVVEGTDARSLRLGPGHMEGTALPGDRDNCIVAGHRDGPFARLPSARAGDIVEISDGARTSRYEILHMHVVPKDDVRDLAPATQPILTLITCYPINHVGPAPNRLVVRAALLEDGPG
jgi:sortase A